MTRKRKTEQRKQRKLKELNRVKELDKRFKSDLIELKEKCVGGSSMGAIGLKSKLL